MFMFGGAACAADDDDDDDDDDVQICDDPGYGDGVCQIDLACAAPDIDCFQIFDSQAEAEASFTTFETESGGAARATLPPTDPRFVKMRAALDRGWDAYKKVHPVADLADHTPHLIVAEDAEINAFVFKPRDSELVPFTVVVLTGLLDLEPTEDELQGMVMHELTHAVGLHVLPGGGDLFRRYYVAPGESEPLGFLQDDDPAARRHGDEWRASAELIGPYSFEDLGGFPFLGQISQVMLTGLGPVGATPECNPALVAFDQLGQDLQARLNTLDLSLTLPANPVRERADAIMAGISDCLEEVGVTDDFFKVTGATFGVTADEVRSQLDPEIVAVVDGKVFADAINDLLLHLRGKMRQAEQGFEAERGEPFSRLRYFSTEENADDLTVPVLDEMGLDQAGAGNFFLKILDEESAVSCAEFLDAGEPPPYGVDLGDEHHANCWRIDHVRRVVDLGQYPDPGVRQNRAANARVNRPRSRPPLLPAATPRVMSWR
jgi:hypothetical protein